MKLVEYYCEKSGPGPQDHTNSRDTFEETIAFRNGHPNVSAIPTIDGPVVIGPADDHGGRRVRPDIALPGEPEDGWDLLCKICGAHIRKRDVK